jgi:hypothetical protein
MSETRQPDGDAEAAALQGCQARGLRRPVRAAMRASSIADQASQKVGVRPLRPWPERIRAAGVGPRRGRPGPA